MTPQPKSLEEIREWLVVHAARELELSVSQIDVTQPLRRFGLDSLAVAGLSGELEIWLGRDLPEDLLNDYPTIQAMAEYLAGETGVRQSTLAVAKRKRDSEQPQDAKRKRDSEQPQELIEHTHLDCRKWSKSQLLTQRLLAVLVRALYRVRIEGLENIPREGAFILASNHLHVFDAPIVFSFMNRRVVTFVSDHMRRVPFVNWFLKHMGSAIYVTRGEGDQQAVASALGVLCGGGALALAPEGKISKTGGLLAGYAGIAHLATLAGVPIIPIVLYGQERPFRLKRALVNIRVGPPIRFPFGKATARQLDSYRDEVMLALARMLPPEYRGMYRDKVNEG
jgi:1-acyl-sn-glycerol-3-phosphate acyltransferase